MKKKNAFTLIELLVVISIIALLLSILMPALGKVKKQAKRVVCSSNLHNWGLAFHGYTSDNDNRLLSSYRASSSSGPIPGIIFLAKQTGIHWKDQIYMDAITPYIPGFDIDNKEMSPAWICPSSAVDKEKLFTEYAATINKPDDQLQLIWFPVSYAYFARADEWGEFSTKPKELTGRYLSGNKLLMADTIYRWQGDGSWWYNHGKDRGSVHDMRFGKNAVAGIPEIEGSNQLSGDGAVNWKKGAEFEPELMENCDAGVLQTFSQSSTPSTSNDTTFW